MDRAEVPAGRRREQIRGADHRDAPKLGALEVVEDAVLMGEIGLLETQKVDTGPAADHRDPASTDEVSRLGFHHEAAMGIVRLADGDHIGLHFGRRGETEPAFIPVTGFRFCRLYGACRRNPERHDEPETL